MNPRACVCVPAHNEEQRLPALFAALAAQRHPGRLRVVVTLNNCDDGSIDVTQDAAIAHADRLDIVADVIRLPPPDAHVGTARERALRHGAAFLVGAGAPLAAQVLLTTDADATPPPDWLDCNLAAIDDGADLVGGRLVAVAETPISGELARRHAVLARYWQAIRDLEDRVDPVPEDPAPRHGDHTGGSLAVRRVVYEEIGGIPALPTGEDVAFVRRAVAAGYKLRHAPFVWTRVSGREEGRAADGMAACMKATREAADRNTALLVPGAAQWHARVAWRARIRAAGGSAAVARAEHDLPPMRDDTPIDRAIADIAGTGCG